MALSCQRSEKLAKPRHCPGRAMIIRDEGKTRLLLRLIIKMGDEILKTNTHSLVNVGGTLTIFRQQRLAGLKLCQENLWDGETPDGLFRGRYAITNAC